MDWQETRASMRKRPEMYVGDIGESGVLVLVLEVLGNAFDQYLLERCARISVERRADGSVVVEDDGPGIAGPSLLTWITVGHDTPTADGHRPHVHLTALNGLGLAMSGALCERLEVVTTHGGETWRAVMAAGELVEAPHRLAQPRARGTWVHLSADPAIFTDGARAPLEELHRRLETLTYLSPGLRLSWQLTPDDGDIPTRSSDGDPDADLATLVAHTAGVPVGDVAHHRGRYDVAGKPIDVEVALFRRPGSKAKAQVASFCNLGRTEDGTHAAGLKWAAGRPLEGLVAAVSILLDDVIYGSPRKNRVLNPEVADVVAAATRLALGY